MHRNRPVDHPRPAGFELRHARASLGAAVEFEPQQALGKCIVFLCEAVGPAGVFVHRPLLSMHSPVFQDLVDGARDRHRGLLHVPMEDTADEVEALLNVVYDGL